MLSMLEQLQEAHRAMRNTKVEEDYWFEVAKFCIELLLRNEIEKLTTKGESDE